MHITVNICVKFQSDFSTKSVDVNGRTDGQPAGRTTRKHDALLLLCGGIKIIVFAMSIYKLSKWSGSDNEHLSARLSVSLSVCSCCCCCWWWWCCPCDAGWCVIQRADTHTRHWCVSAMYITVQWSCFMLKCWRY